MSVRTVTFKSVLHGVAKRMGIDPDTGDLSVMLAARVTEHINERVREACEYDWWPEWMVTERRQYALDYVAGGTYASGERVYDATEDGYYESAQDANTGNAVTDTDWWTPMGDWNRYIPLVMTGFTDIGEIRRLTNHDPRTNQTYPDPVGYWLTAEGVQMSDLAGNRPYAEFRRRAPEFSSTAWVVATSYAVDALTYLESPGESYICIQAGSNQNPSTETAYWTKVDFPYTWARYVKMGAYADELRAQGQSGKADKHDDKALDQLFWASQVAGAQQGQNERARVTAYPQVA